MVIIKRRLCGLPLDRGSVVVGKGAMGYPPSAGVWLPLPDGVWLLLELLEEEPLLAPELSLLLELLEEEPLLDPELSLLPELSPPEPLGVHSKNAV